MIDQADKLREVVTNKSAYDMESMQTKNKGLEIITITSGKGGVGKTSFAVNFGITLCERGKRVVIMDADFGLSNVDLVLGVNSKYDITDMISGEKSIGDILSKGYGGLKTISGGSGLDDLVNLSNENFEKIISNISELENYADVLIIDTGAGVNERIIRMINASHETILIITPDPTSIMDAFALMKSLVSDNTHQNVRIVINRADTIEDGLDIGGNFIDVVKKFLGATIGSLGVIVADKAVSRAVIKQIPFVIANPSCLASKQVNAIVDEYLNIESTDKKSKGGMGEFLKRLIRKK